MDRNREARRASSIVGSNGFNRRRHRTNSLRDSPDEDGGMELQESVRLRDRVKKDRDRERERERDRERERGRERERERERERDLRERSSRSKRRRGERLTSNREDIGGDETSEESVNDEEDDEDEEATTTGGSGGVRLLTAAAAAASGSIPNHHHGHLSNHHHGHSSNFSQPQHNNNNTSNPVSSNHHLQHRKSFPPASSTASKISRAPPVWKSGDEMISAPVPRKARSVSTKRSHDWISISNNNSGGGVSGGESNLGSSPARQSVVPTPMPAAPMSPSSSNPSMRKKLKPAMNNSGPKLKPPKVAAAAAAAAAAPMKPSSSNPEELEIEIAEVLYGLMTQSQAPLSKKEDSREINRLSSDAKSRNSSPISNTAAANNPNLGSNSGPLSAVAPKRKRPRQIPENSSYSSRSSPIPAKPDAEQTPKSEISSPTTEKISGSAAENVQVMVKSSVDPQEPPPERAAPTATGSAKVDSEMKRAVEESRESRDSSAKEEVTSPKDKESQAVRVEVSLKRDSPAAAAAASSVVATSKTNSTANEVESRKEEKFEIDLMAPPPQVKPSPETEAKIDLRESPVDQKPVISVTDTILKRSQAEENGKSAAQEKKIKGLGEEGESTKERNGDLEKSDRDGGDGVGNGNKSQSLTLKHQHLTPLAEKSGHSTSSLPMPMSMASWPGAGGLPPMGYMAPLQGVVSVEGGAVAPAHIPPLFSQPRPKRCATHCHIARNIHYLQQFMKMNPFWPAPAAASASLFGSKPCNLNVIPGLELHGNVAVRGTQDKNQSVATVPNHVGKEKGAQLQSTASDSSQRKQQILIQQALPPVAPSNLMGPTFIFPLNQQQQQNSTAPRPNGAKSPATGVSSNTSNSAVPNTSSAAAAAAVSFNYPNMASNETQYLAILQNNGYPFPIPAAAVGGAPPNFRGTPAQAMPLFNGSFYSSQMIHPSQLQQASIQSQLLQAHQNASASSNSSSSQKHMQNQRIQSGVGSSSSGTATLQNLSSQKSQPSQQQLQQSHSQYVHQSRGRHLEGEPNREDSPSATDNTRGSRPPMNIYAQNFAMQNFGLMTHPGAAAATATSASNNNNHGEKKHQQSQGSKAGPETAMPAHTFAMTFGTINGATGGQGIDIASMAQNHALFQSSSEATRQNMQMMAAAAAAHNKKNFRMSDDGKSGGGDSSAPTEDERKSLSGKGGGGQSIAFTRSDLNDGPVVESSTRSLNAASGGNRSSRSLSANAMNVHNTQNIQVHLQQHQQMMQLKQQQQQQHQQQQQQQQQQIQQQLQQQQQQQMAANAAAAAANRSKAPATSNGGMYSEHFNSSSAMGTKFPSAISGFPQNLVQSNSTSPSQSPQWKNSGRNPTTQNPSSLASSTSTSLKNLPQQQQQQQHSRNQAPMHTQISFGGNQKPSTLTQGQTHPTANQNSSSPMMVGSPTTSSVSKGASGSPRPTSSASTNNKSGPPSSLSAQANKNSPSVSNQKSPSILGNLHIGAPASSGSVQKSQMQQQQQSQSQQQMSKAMQQQLFFSSPYVHSHPTHSSSKSSNAALASGYYMQQRRQTEQSLGANTNDPATAIAAATANVKVQSQGMMHAAQFAHTQATGTLLPTSFSYPNPVSAGVQAKPAEQKQQPAGNDNLNPWQPEKK